jgi:hypothetical protein
MALGAGIVVSGTADQEHFGPIMLVLFLPLWAGLLYGGYRLFRNGARQAKRSAPDPWAPDPDLDGPDAEDL